MRCRLGGSLHKLWHYDLPQQFGKRSLIVIKEHVAGKIPQKSRCAGKRRFKDFLNLGSLFSSLNLQKLQRLLLKQNKLADIPLICRIIIVHKDGGRLMSEGGEN